MEYVYNFQRLLEPTRMHTEALFIVGQRPLLVWFFQIEPNYVVMDVI